MGDVRLSRSDGGGGGDDGSSGNNERQAQRAFAWNFLPVPAAALALGGGSASLAPFLALISRFRREGALRVSRDLAVMRAK